MNTASLELSMELYKLTGWGETEHWQHVEGSYTQGCPAYDLGYLIRKLPDGVNIMYNSERSAASFEIAIEEILLYGNTPEDAAAKLCIRLFKQKILTA